MWHGSKKVLLNDELVLQKEISANAARTNCRSCTKIDVGIHIHIHRSVMYVHLFVYICYVFTFIYLLGRDPCTSMRVGLVSEQARAQPSPPPPLGFVRAQALAPGPASPPPKLSSGACGASKAPCGNLILCIYIYLYI